MMNPLQERLSRSELSSIYISCRELPLDRFRKMWREGETPLYLDRGYDPNIEDYHTTVHPDILVELWGHIQLEYTELMDGGNLARTLKAALRIEECRIKYDLINSCIALLSIYHSPEVITILSELGYSVSTDPNQDMELYLLELNRIRSLAKEIQVEIDILRGELDNPVAPVKTEDDSDDWLDTLLLLEEDCGFRLLEESIVVYEYTRRVKKYMKKLKQKIQQAKKGHAVSI